MHGTMAHNGFRVLDSDIHIMEPPDLWERYIDTPFKHRAPRGFAEWVLLMLPISGKPGIDVGCLHCPPCLPFGSTAMDPFSSGLRWS